MFESRATGPSPSLRRLILLLAISVLLVPTLSQAQAIIKINDNINLRFGVLLQGWADSTQDPATRGYSNGIFLRRMRILIGGQVSPNISFFFETDNPNLGRTPKNLGGGFITQDAFVEWKPTGSNAFMLDAGLMLPPLCRNCVESAATLLSLDYGSFSFLESAATQSSVGRDTGLLAKGYLAGNHLEYRAGVFNGFRSTATSSHPAGSNGFRAAGRLQYNLFDTETGYTYPGVYLGNKRIVAIGAGVDKQQDYRAVSVDGFISIPMGGPTSTASTTGPTGTPATTPPPATATAHNALNGELTLIGYDGGTTFPTALPEQRIGTAQLGFYLAGPKVMPWIRAEKQDFKATANNGRDNTRQQVGLTWYPNGHNFNVKGAYSRVDPRAGNKTNEYTIQLQFFYY